MDVLWHECMHWLSQRIVALVLAVLTLLVLGSPPYPQKRVYLMLLVSLEFGFRGDNILVSPQENFYPAGGVGILVGFCATLVLGVALV